MRTLFCAALVGLSCVGAQAAPFAYVPNSGSNTVSVIDIATDIVVKDIAVGAAPVGVAVAPGGERIFVTNGKGSSVSVIDGKTQTVIATIPVGSNPRGVAVTEDAQRVLVANNADGTVTMIDGETLNVLGTASVGVGPMGVTAFKWESSSDALHEVFVVAVRGCSCIKEVGTDLTVHTMAVVGPNPYDLEVGGINRLWVTDGLEGGARVISMFDYGDIYKWLVQPIVLGGGRSTGIAYRSDPDANQAMFIALPDSQRVWVDLATGPDMPIVGMQTPMGVSVTPAGDKVYVTDFAANAVSVVDAYTRQVVDVVTVGSHPMPLGRFIQSPIDRVPDHFSFPPLTGVSPSSPWVGFAPTSKSVVLTGFTDAAPLSIECPASDSQCGYSIAGGAWSRMATSVTPDTPVRVRVRASMSYSTTTAATLKVGGRSATFSVTTKALAKK